MPSTTFGDPDDDFIQFLFDEWKERNVNSDDSEFGKFLTSFIQIVGFWNEDSSDAS